MVDATKIQLHYYKAHGRAQQIRYCLAAGGVEFENAFPAGGYPPSAEDKAKWVAIGKNTTTNVPMLVQGDKVYSQSSGCIRVAARKGGLMPTDDEEAAECDAMIAHADDLRSISYGALGAFGASPEA